MATIEDVLARAQQVQPDVYPVEDMTLDDVQAAMISREPANPLAMAQQYSEPVMQQPMTQTRQPDQYDRITQLLQKAQQQPQGEPLTGLDMLGSYMNAYGRGKSYTDVKNEEIARRQGLQDRQIQSGKDLLAVAEQKAASGDKAFGRMLERVKLFTGDDPEGQAAALEYLESLPYDIDPSNAAQVLSELGKWSKQTGYKSYDLAYQRQKKQLELEQMAALSERYKAQASGADGGVPGGVTGEIVTQLMADNPNMTYTQALQLYQAGLKSGIRYNPDGSSAVMPGFAESKQQIAGAEAFGTRTGQIEAVGADALPTQRLNIMSFEDKKATIDDEASKIKANANAWTSGFMGNIGSYVAGTPAYDLSQSILTIKANIGFDKLQEMRDQSPTGGALGQVAIQELQALQSSLVSIQQAQSPQQLVQNVAKLQTKYDNMIKRMRAAFEADRKRFGPKATYDVESTLKELEGTPQTLVGGRTNSKVRVSNGTETLTIDASDLPDAQAEGFKVIE